MAKRTGARNKSVSQKSNNLSNTAAKQHICPFCGVLGNDTKFMKAHISQHIKEQVLINKVLKQTDMSNDGEHIKKEESDVTQTKFVKTSKIENSNSFEINVNAEDFVLNNIKEEDQTNYKTKQDKDSKELKSIKIKFYHDSPSERSSSKTLAQAPLSKYECECCKSEQDDSGAHLLFSHDMLTCGKDDRCHQFFSSMEQRRIHEKDVHQDGKDSAAAWKDTCGACQERMTDLYSLVEHRMVRHGLNTCTLCGIIMNGREHFAKHVKTHNIRNVEIFNLKPEYPILEKMLNHPIGIFDRDDLSVECNLCPLKTENLDYAWKTVKVGEGGIKFLHHYEYAHKVKNPASTLLKMFNGREFHFKTLKVQKEGSESGTSVKRKDNDSDEEDGKKKSKSLKTTSKLDDDPDDPDEI